MVVPEFLSNRKYLRLCWNKCNIYCLFQQFFYFIHYLVIVFVCTSIREVENIYASVLGISECHLFDVLKCLNTFCIVTEITLLCCILDLITKKAVLTMTLNNWSLNQVKNIYFQYLSSLSWYNLLLVLTLK